MTNTSDVVELTAIDLAQKILVRLTAIERFTGHEYAKVRQDILARAIDIVGQLRARRSGDHDLHADQHDAAVICEVLFGVGQDPSAEFWDTPLGTDVAWAIGYPLPDVPIWAAAAVLHMTRQSVWLAISEGRLAMTPESIRGHLRGSKLWQTRTAELEAAHG